MTTANRNFAPPKQTVLTENETITSYANWQSNILFHLSLCNDFAPYLDSEWSKQGVTSRGLTDDPNTVDQADRKTAVQKVIILERMLALIAQFAPSLLRNEIIKRSTSLSSIWQRIRRHYGFNQSEVNFLNLCEIKRKESERYETYYQRIVAHIEDNLLTVASNLQHDGAIPTVDETISPTTERLAVYLWLHTIDQRLPGYVARVYAHDLQSQTLKDIQPQLSRSMDALLAELAAQTDIQIHYANSSYKYRPKRTLPPKPSKSFQSSRQSADKECSLCKATGRVYKGHNIASCWHISKIEKMEMAKALRVTTEHPIDDDDDDNNDDIYEEFLPNNISRCVCEKASNNVKVTSSTAVAPSEPQIKQVECDISPFFYAFYDHHPVHIVIDSGATSSVVSKSFLHSVGITPKNTLHSARSADKSKLIVSGEIHITLTLGNQILPLTALVINKR